MKTCLAAGLVGATLLLLFPGAKAMPQEPAAKELSALEFAVGIEGVLVDVIEKAERSVVSIARVRKPPARENLSFEFRPDPFGRRATPFASPAPTDPDFIPNEFATGVVVGREGLILTAHHVLAEDSEYFVTTHDRKVFFATVKGADPRSDLAVLSVEATDLEPIAFGDGASLRKGQIVLALGNPYAIARDGQVSASWGIVANLTRKAPLVTDERHPTGKSTLHHFGTLIQTDAKLNLGTSGGPLLNLRGEMVGLTMSLAATAGYEQSAGYAVPVDETFRRVVETLKHGREVEYGFLGISPRNLGPELVRSGLFGARIDWVVPGAPAARFGLKPGDVVTHVNGKPIYDADGLVLEVGRLPVESTAGMRVIRDGRPMELELGLTKYQIRGKKIVTTPSPGWRGVRIDYLSAAIDSFSRGALDGPAFDDGVAVIDVEEQSAGWEAGLRSGMLISRVDQAEVHNPGEFQKAVSDKAGAVELHLVKQDDQQLDKAIVREPQPR